MESSLDKDNAAATVICLEANDNPMKFQQKPFVFGPFQDALPAFSCNFDRYNFAMGTHTLITRPDNGPTT